MSMFLPVKPAKNQSAPWDVDKQGEPHISDDTGKGYAEGTISGFVVDQKEEQRLVWKFDLRILPILTIMYLFNSLDKSNMGNAKTHGLEKDLGLQGDDYNIALSVFYVPYVLTAPFLGFAGKKYGPSRVLPLMMFTFGTMTLLVTATENFAGLMVLRWFLGMAESAFFPLVIYYQTTRYELMAFSFYRRGELARRLAVFYAASNIASAFGGLISYGVFQIASGSISSWRYLFVVEGAASILFSGFAYWVLPMSAAEATFLTDEEKSLAFYRMNNNLADENQRLVLTTVGVPVANLMGLVSSNIFQNKDKPKYMPALITTAVFGVTGCMLTTILGAWMIYDNKRRNLKQGTSLQAKDVPSEKLRDGPNTAEFRWFY
ncbi:putative MFS transporter [Aureobasidium sp. EXF-3400]|nr:putative MFS transporter [Aureobasidium sp. EXF-12344]KAI4768530.1 putative MFS transporter [Aureobasidium sp. EXF-3400]